MSSQKVLDLAHQLRRGLGGTSALRRCWTTSERRRRAYFADPEEYQLVEGSYCPRPAEQPDG